MATIDMGAAIKILEASLGDDVSPSVADNMVRAALIIMKEGV